MKRVVRHKELLRVFVGTSAGGEAEACMVLEYSLRKRASVPFDLTWLWPQRSGPCSGWKSERWITPWTAFRWAVPALCGWQGRAVYFDCTTIVLGDIAELANADFPRNAFVLAHRERSILRTGCLVFDCVAAKKWVPDLNELRADVGAHQRLGGMLERHRNLVGPLPSGWGWGEAAYSADPDAATGSVHCVNMWTQPHTRYALPRLRKEGRTHWFDEIRLPHYCAGLVKLFDDEYVEAQEAGHKVEEYVELGGKVDA